MKKVFAKFCSIITICFTFILLCSCSSNNFLDLSVYLKSEAIVKSVDKIYSSSQAVSTFDGRDDFFLSRYKYITFETNPKWSNGLTLEKIEFIFISSIDVDLDYIFTITGLNESESYDTTGEFFYYTKNLTAQLTANSPYKISIPLFGKLTEKASQISINIDDSEFSNKDFSYTITNLKISAEHIQEQY